MKAKNYLAISLIGAIMGSMFTFMTLPFFASDLINTATTTAPSPLNTTINVSDKHVDNIYKAIISKGMPSVVGITTVSPSLSSILGGDTNLGTGFIIDVRGYILTNSHVVDDGNAKQVTVKFSDSTSTPAEILWTDKAIDLAIIKVEKENLPVAELGDSDTVEVGDISVAIGNPIGLEFERTATEGIISGLERSIMVKNMDGTTTQMDGLMQTSAAINPGNSGGPLLNMKGQVIGINSAKAREGEGLGFAIPINVAKPIVDQFIKNGSFKKVVMGINVVDVRRYQQELGVDMGVDQGLIIVKMESGSIAEKSGLQSLDVILKLGKQEIKTREDLMRYLYQVKEGDKVKAVVWRNDKEVEVDIQF